MWKLQENALNKNGYLILVTTSKQKLLLKVMK